jgi:hypothetical protein
MSAQMIDFYRKTCFTGTGGPESVEWTTGVCPALTITPVVGQLVRVTGLCFMTQTVFDIVDAFRISPWGYGTPAQVDISSFAELINHCINVTPVILGTVTKNYHKLYLPFQPFIEVSDTESTVFAVENSAGATGVLTGSVPIFITAYSYSVDEADA